MILEVKFTTAVNIKLKVEDVWRGGGSKLLFVGEV